MGISPKKKDSGEGGVTVEYGAVKTLHAIAERIGLIDIVNQAAPKRNGLPVGELAFIMAANRLLDPRPKYTIAEWYQRTYMPEILGIDLPPDSAYQTLTRCLDYLTDDVQMDVEMALAARVMESFHLKPGASSTMSPPPLSRARVGRRSSNTDTCHGQLKINRSGPSETNNPHPWRANRASSHD